MMFISKLGERESVSLGITKLMVCVCVYFCVVLCVSLCVFFVCCRNLTQGLLLAE